MAKLRKTIFSAILISLALLPPSIAAKTRSVLRATISTQLTGNASQEQIRKLEQRLRPFLERKLRGFPERSGRSTQDYYVPHETDFMALARVWDRLSVEFKSLYRQATQIPPSFIRMESPGGHFEVYFTKKGKSGVDSTDNYGYGLGADWRVKSSGSNGVPDYVDEVAWSLDSSWSMEIDKFGFARPIPLVDSMHPSDRYKVVVTSPDYDSFYGMTYVVNKAPNSSKGFSSYIEINNNWSGPEWSDMSYNQHPEYGARVTSAHEFFHAIQYAMCWDVNGGVYLDDFPITWVEGSAVLMEELAFDSINDYLQYSDQYFDDPGMALLDLTYDWVTEYTNSLITKYLYERATGTPRIDFVKTILTRNFERATPFHDNLRATAAQFGTPWVDILNGFHTASYFTGPRADTTIFLKDAALFKTWKYYPDELDYSNTVQRTIEPYGMEVFAIRPSASHGDTISMFFNGRVDEGDTVTQRWAVSCILRRPSRADSLIKLRVDERGIASLELTKWKSSTELLTIASNGYSQAHQSASVYYEVCPIRYVTGAQARLSAASPGNESVAKAGVTAIGDLRCDMTLKSYQNDTITDPANLSGKTAVSSFFNFSFPPSWADSAEIELKIGLIWTLRSQNQSINLDSVSIFRWDPILYSWIEESSILSESGDTLYWTAKPTQPGVFGLLNRKMVAGADSAVTKITVFPNPARIQKGESVHFQGRDIELIRVYSADGMLVCNAATGTAISSPAVVQYSRGGYSWKLTNNAGKKVVPGLYLAVIGCKDPITKGMKTVRRNVMVYP